MGIEIRILLLMGTIPTWASMARMEHPWPMLLGDADHLGKPEHSSVLPAKVPQVKWKFKAPGAVESSAVVSGNGLVFAAGGSTVFALDKATGGLRWKFKAKKQVLASGALGGSALLIGADDEQFYALDQATGKLLWQFQGGEFTGGATVSEDLQTVYVGSGAKKLHAYFLNGSRRFDFSAAAQVAGTPALDNKHVYFGDDAGFFYKLDATTGEQLWKLKFDGNLRAPARIGPEGIFIGIGDPDDLKSGEIIRLNLDGTVRWKSDCGQEEKKCESCWTSPAVVGDVVVAGCGLDTVKSGKIWGLDLESGNVRWVVKAGNDCQTSSPVVRGGAVLLGCTDGGLYAIEAANGSVRWKWQAKKGIWATPAIDQDGTIFIGSHDNFLYALHAGEPGAIKKSEF